MGSVGRFLRSIAVSALMVALLNAPAGLCLCARGPAAPGQPAAPHGCCHGQDGAGARVTQASSSCCHIEAAARDATPADAVQLAQPEATAVPAHESAGPRVIAPVATTVCALSPPARVLRI